MGRIKKESALGKMSGAVGNVVLSQWNQTPVVRSRQGKKTKPSSQAQMEQHAKMALAVEFARSMNAVVSAGFRDYSNKMSGYNAAVKHVLEVGIVGQYPDYDLNYSVIPVSKGVLLHEAKPAATFNAGEVVFTWQYAADVSTLPNDKAMLAVYCPALKKSLFTMAGGDRNTGTAAINVARFQGHEVHTWLAFISPDGKKTSDSAYTGKLMVT